MTGPAADEEQARLRSELVSFGIKDPGRLHRNLSAARLVEAALSRGEGALAENGALCVRTGMYTGRSPQDKYIVDTEAVRADIDWGPVNVMTSTATFDRLHSRQLEYLAGRELFVFDGFVGADPEHRMAVRVVNELAWHNLFARQLFIRPSEAELASHRPEFTVVSTPGLKAVPERDGTRSEVAMMMNFEKKVVMILSTAYAGEMKKSMFTVMNLLMPKRGVFPMHCSANVGMDGETALFFGLSGTGKTTLSADPRRRMIGDDEHGWSARGVFNFEGGCYAKCIKLSQRMEPQIWDAIRFGAVVENAVLDPATRKIDYDDASVTENARAAYPVEFIPGSVVPGVGRHPRTIVFLTADAFGVMPPIAKLSEEATMYHFLSGYTSKLAGTERGVVEPVATFSACFGAPFLPLAPTIYARLLCERIAEHRVKVFMIDTGWLWGPYGVGRRIPIKYTRQMVTAALETGLGGIPFYHDPLFNLDIPETCCEAPEELLRPRETWKDGEAYDRAARKLARMFVENFKRFKDAPREVVEAGPHPD